MIGEWMNEWHSKAIDDKLFMRAASHALIVRYNAY